MANIINAFEGSTCKYLFGKEADEIFENIKFPKPNPLFPQPSDQDKSKFIDKCLELLMRVNLFLLSKKDAFFLIDPRAYNNQCHLYALKVAQLKAAYHQKSEEEKQARSEDNRFLHLSFFLSYHLIGNGATDDTSLLIATVKAALKEMQENVKDLTRKKFEAFLRDEGRCREKAAYTALNQLFESEMKKTLALRKGELDAELSQMAYENLHIASSRGMKMGKFYTYPKLAGIAYIMDVLAKEHIPFVVKVKVLTKDGTLGTIMQASHEMPKDGSQPVVVFEAVAADGVYTVPQIREEAQKCPSYFYRNKAKLHKKEESCFFCKSVQADLEPFRQRLRMAMQQPQEMLYALGADFILNVQKEFKPLFENREKYPLLSQIFQQAIPKIEELGLAMNHPKTFSICHVHTDNASQAYSEKMLLDSPPETLLKSREII